MITDAYREDEIQALIVLDELTDPVETPNNNHYAFFPRDVGEARMYFRRSALDLSDAFETLTKRGLVQEDDAWALTPPGKAIADEIRRLRPPIWYWYVDFYKAIENSGAFSEYCRRVFGRDLGQHGFSDLSQIHRMLEVVRPDRASQVLDIGCGNGKIAEYVSELTHASVTGVDYVPEAITQALARTRDKRERLRFKVGDIEALNLEAESFDVILSIDSVFFGTELRATLANLEEMLKAGGQMAIFFCGDLSAALRENDLPYEVHDLSQAHHEHLQLKHRVASELREAFEEEGNGFIWDNLMTESAARSDPYDPATCSATRFLYHAKRDL